MNSTEYINHPCGTTAGEITSEMLSASSRKNIALIQGKHKRSKSISHRSNEETREDRTVTRQGSNRAKQLSIINSASRHPSKTKKTETCSGGANSSLGHYQRVNNNSGSIISITASNKGGRKVKNLSVSFAGKCGNISSENIDNGYGI